MSAMPPALALPPASTELLKGPYETNYRYLKSRKRIIYNYTISQQVFKTASRGWGIRTLVDMPGGAFVCTYVGNLFTAEESNSIGKNFGDEYFAELDLVENVEGHKDGWESDVVEPGEDSDKEESKVEESEEVKSSVDDAEDEAGEGPTKKRRSSRLAVVQLEKKQKKLEDSKKGRMVSARKLFGKGCCIIKSLMGCHPNWSFQVLYTQGRTKRPTLWTPK